MGKVPIWVALLVVIVAIAGVCTALAFVPTDDVAYAPHEPVDLAGRVRIGGRSAEPLQGQLSFVGVTVRPVSLLQRWLLDIGDPDVEFGPAGDREIYGPRDEASMDLAKRVAAGLAMAAAEERVVWTGDGVVVDSVDSGSTVGARLRAGDFVDAVNGRPVDTSIAVMAAVDHLPPSSTVRLSVRRAGRPSVVAVTTLPATRNDDGRRSRLGVQLTTVNLRVDLPREIAIDSGDVVGPSAGLPFALSIYDSLAAEDLLRGRHVVASGALTPSPTGQVLPVERITQKGIAVQRAGTDVFVVAKEDEEQARAAVERTCDDGESCTRVVGVSSFAEAVRALRS